MRAPLAFSFMVLLCFTAGAEESSSAPRIISLYAAHTEILLRLGARDCIVGVSRQETYSGPETEGWNPPVFSARDDIERFLAAAPDIVLVRPQHVADGRLKRVLETAGIRVIAMQVTRADDLYEYWRELGRLVGREAEAEAMIASFAAEANRYRQAALARINPPGVFLESIHREVKTFTPDSLPAWVVESGGGRNIAADAEPASPGVIIAEYGPERLLDKADEVEIFISQSGAMNRTPLESVLARDVYAPLAAFRTGRVYKIPEAFIARPTPSLLEGVRMMAEWTGLSPDDDVIRE